MKKSFALTIIVFMLFSLAVPLIKVEPTQAAVTGSFGYTGAATDVYSLAADDMRGSLFSSGSGATGVAIYSITWNGNGTTGTHVKAFLVSAAKVILATSDPITLTAGDYAWHTNTFSTPAAISASTNYYLIIMADADVNFTRTTSGTDLLDLSNSYASPTNPTDAADFTYKFLISANYAAYTATLTSSPAIGATITMNSTEYTTPASPSVYRSTYTFTAETLKIYGGTGYIFDHWLVNGTTTYTTASVSLSFTGDTTIAAHYNITDVLELYGPYSESTGLLLSENVTVTVHYSDGGVPNDSFTLTGGSHIFEPSGTVLYLHYLFSDNSTREYWVDPSEATEIFYVYRDTTLTDYTLNFMDYTSVLAAYPYVTAQTYVNGSYASVEKVKVDEENTFVMHLVEGTRYQFLIGNEDYTYVYGDVLMTGSTTVQLILKGTDFPKETLLMYPYLTLYANRTFVSGSDAPIIIRYLDSKDETLNFTITFTDQNGVNAYTYTGVSSDITLTWDSAVDTNSYTVSVEIEHTTYGTYTWKQYLQAEGGAPVNLDLSFLGSWSIDLTYFIPIILIVIVAGCFSAMNAEVGAIVAAILAIILTYMGWIPIAPGLLVTALSLAILMALVYNKRRIQPY